MGGRGGDGVFSENDDRRRTGNGQNYDRRFSRYPSFPKNMQLQIVFTTIDERIGLEQKFKKYVCVGCFPFEMIYWIPNWKQPDICPGKKSQPVVSKIQREKKGCQKILILMNSTQKFSRQKQY